MWNKKIVYAYLLAGLLISNCSLSNAFSLNTFNSCVKNSFSFLKRNGDIIACVGIIALAAYVFWNVYQEDEIQTIEQPTPKEKPLAIRDVQTMIKNARQKLHAFQPLYVPSTTTKKQKRFLFFAPKASLPQQQLASIQDIEQNINEITVLVENYKRCKFDTENLEQQTKNMREICIFFMKIFEHIIAHKNINLFDALLTQAYILDQEVLHQLETIPQIALRLPAPHDDFLTACAASIKTKIELFKKIQNENVCKKPVQVLPKRSTSEITTITTTPQITIETILSSIPAKKRKKARQKIYKKMRETILKQSSERKSATQGGGSSSGDAFLRSCLCPPFKQFVYYKNPLYTKHSPAAPHTTTQTH